MKRLAGGLLLGLLTSAVAAGTPTIEEMWVIIQQQQAEIEQLKRQLGHADTQLAETRQMIDATATAVEKSQVAGAGGTSDRGSTYLGGYAELHYNHLGNDKPGGKDKDEIDVHRFVLLVGHDFSERTRFHSELEVEHSWLEGGEGGEVALEQAYIEHDLGSSQYLRAGLFLLPVGIINETHEPNTFYGVERNNVETNIVPSTWWEGGLGLGGELAPGFSYDATLTSGLGLDADEGQWAVRDGRQNVSEADASVPAYTGRLKYTGVAGLELAATLQYQQDLYQGEFSQDVDGWLYEAHIAWATGPFALRALYASWYIDEAITLFKEGADKQEGWYIEPAWRFNPQWGVFARYSDWDNQAGADADTGYEQWDLGLNYWLEENVVFKLDYQSQDAPDGEDQLDGVNLGVGWSY